MQDLPNPTPASEDVNPYVPPKAELLPVADGVGLEDAYGTASRMKRFINWVIDRGAVFGVLFALGWIGAAAEELGYITGFIDRLDRLSTVEDILLTAVITVLYYWVMEALWGRTLGKLITGTKVIDNAGLPVGSGTVLKRSLIRIVPLEPFSMLLGSAWHDVWSGTQVIDLREKQPLRLSPVLGRAYR